MIAHRTGKCLQVLLLACLTFGLATRAHAQSVETKILVRALAHDAKIIGSGVGGAWITIEDVVSGRILAEGHQQGGTGDTRLLVSDPPERGETRYDTQGAASFLAILQLERPTWVDITAYGPMDAPESMQRTTKRMLLIPGHDVLGEGVIVELNGFFVDILSPLPESGAVAGDRVSVRARVVMLCGCPTEPGGLWNADDIVVTARLLQGDIVRTESVLPFAGTTSTYEGMIALPSDGAYVLEVLAADPGKANFGLKRTELAVSR